MPSIGSYLKQTPRDTPYFISLQRTTGLNLNVFIANAAASTTSYVSGAAEGHFATSNTGPLSDTSGNGTTTIFRDLGVTLVSSGRTFRGVQLLITDTNGGSGWTSTTSGTPGVWQPSNQGVNGAPPANSLQDSGFDVFFFETGANGLGLAQGLIRYG